MDVRIWGYEHIHIMETIHLKFFKPVLNRKSCTKSFMVYGENKRFPFSFNICFRMVSYWAKLFSDPKNKSVHILYKYLLALYNYGFFKNPLIDGMHSISDNFRFSKIWIEQCVNVNLINNTFKQRLKTPFCADRSVHIGNSSKDRVYNSLNHLFVYIYC